MIDARLPEIQDVIHILVGDVKECENSLRSKPSAFSKRIWVRAVFALIEGMTYQMRQLALELAQHHTSLLSQSETKNLEEKERFLKTAEGVKRTLKAFAKTMSVSYQFDGGSGWDAFQKSLHVRHRITHPKGAHGLDISDGEIKQLEAAGNWFRQQWFSIVPRSNGGIRSHLNK